MGRYKCTNSLEVGEAGSELLGSQQGYMRKEICYTVHVPCWCIYISFLFGALRLQPTQPPPIALRPCLHEYTRIYQPPAHARGRSYISTDSHIQTQIIRRIHTMYEYPITNTLAASRYETYHVCNELIATKHTMYAKHRNPKHKDIHVSSWITKQRYKQVCMKGYPCIHACI